MARIKIKNLREPKPPIEHPRYRQYAQAEFSRLSGYRCFRYRFLPLSNDEIIVMLPHSLDEEFAEALQRELRENFHFKRVTVLGECEPLD